MSGDGLRTEKVLVTQELDLAPGVAREVLFAYERPFDGPAWARQISERLQPTGLVVSHVDSLAATVRRVERGGLSAAVLMADRTPFEGLSSLRVIRSIDCRLPCWFVTRETTRRTLEAALELRTTVLSFPVEVSELTLALRRVLLDCDGGPCW
ncbi:MAG: hypothetical protein HY763_04355 [Planctomycetes bacterium]|nr:hypothetical protein [Planctomycetota bacterium]